MICVPEWELGRIRVLLWPRPFQNLDLMYTICQINTRMMPTISAHYESTGPEIWAQTNGKVSHFFTGCGTGGTITGVATYLKEKKKDVRIIAIQAQQNHLLQGLRNFQESAMPDLFKRRQGVVDHWITATNKDSFNMARELAIRENLLVGPSSGSVMASMLELADGLEDGVFVGLFADDGRKFKSLYLEHGIFTTSEYENLIISARNLPHFSLSKEQVTLSDLSAFVCFPLATSLHPMRPYSRTLLLLSLAYT